jgi:hypothetical protein
MKTSETQSALIAAMFAAKQAFPPIPKTKDGQSGNRRFKYAPLEDINAAIDPILWANGLFLTQFTEGHELVTRLEHISGEWREMRMPVNSEHANLQSYGIELTYLRRYSVPMLLGIVTQEDIDIKGKEKRQGVDNTEERNDNGTLRIEGGSHSGPALIFSELPPEVQDGLRKLAPSVTACMPNALKAKETAQIICDEFPDVEINLVRTGLWYLLDSKTRSAIKGVQ